MKKNGVRHITRITYKQDPQKGEPGQRGAVRRVLAWAPNLQWYAGKGEEPYDDVAWFNGVYYHCLRTHTSTTKTPYELHNSPNLLERFMWQPIPGFQQFASMVGFIGEGAEGWIIDKGVIYHSSKNIKLTAAGEIETASDRYKVDKTGKVYAVEADIKRSTLTDVVVTGTMRSPFVPFDGAWIIGGNISTEAEIHDNLIVPASQGFTTDLSFPWDASQNGRTITVVHYKYNGNISQGISSINAPEGMCFFEDGTTKKEITISRELLVLRGYGEAEKFYGWIVLLRENIGTKQKYGRKLRVLAQGIVVGSSSGASLKNYKTFDGSKLSVTRKGLGKYQVGFPYLWGLSPDHYIVMLTGMGHAMKASLTRQLTNAFEVVTSDDASLNEGSFMFQLINLDDWN